MTDCRPPVPARRGQRGVTLVELMVGITIGLVIVAAMSLLFANSSRSRAETERAGTKIENARFALDTLADDLQHAGYLGELDPRPLTFPAAKPGACDFTTPAALAPTLALPALGFDNVTSPQLGASALACLVDAQPGTDVVVVRRAATCVEGSAGCTALAAGMPAFQASLCSQSSELGGIDVANYYRLADGATGTFDLHLKDCTTPAPRRRYIVHIYYVAAYDRMTGGVPDGIPSLKRLELDPTQANGTAVAGYPSWSQVTLAQGVQDLQVEWGLDTDGDGAPNLYATNPDLYCASTSPVVAAGACWGQVVAAKLSVLARNTTPSPGYADNRRYVLGKAGDGTTGVSTSSDYTAGPFADAYKRGVYQRVAALQNITGRRFAP